jgi:hypothetical protein
MSRVKRLSQTIAYNYYNIKHISYGVMNILRTCINIKIAILERGWLKKVDFSLSDELKYVNTNLKGLFSQGSPRPFL